MMKMIKEWYIKIDSIEEGPYSLLDLRRHLRLTPDTLVKKVGTTKWIPIRKVAELKEVFTDEEPNKELKDCKQGKKGLIGDQVVAIDNRHDPSNFLLLLLIIFIVLSYTVYLIRNR